MNLEIIAENFKQKLGRRFRRVRVRRVLTAVTLPFWIYLLYSFMDPPEPVNTQANLLASTSEVTLGAFNIVKPTLKFGFALDTFHVSEAIISPNQFLADILIPHKIDFVSIDKIAKEGKDTFDVRNLRVGKKYTVLSRDTAIGADYFIYEPNVFEYIVFDLQKDKQINIVRRPVETVVETASGIINSSLWVAMTSNGYSPDLTARMEDALAWSIDFHHIQKGDRFKLVYQRKYIDGEPVGVGEIDAAYYENEGKGFYAIRYENERHNGFYDLEARSMEKAFLKSPVKYSRISSRFNRNRFHPVLKRRKAHLGTDYAAPRGTPIYAVADGVVVKSSRSRGNGNYVKIKHDNIYQTQYLHMQKQAKGIRPGVHVKQGEVIGYVGSTGLATGPHVCFRFWKNGKQVNHLKQNLPPPEPMPEEDIPAYMAHKEVLKAALDAIQYPGEEKEVETDQEELTQQESKETGTEEKI